MEMSQKIFECYSLRLAMYLIDQGFTVMKLRPDTKNSRNMVYFFNETPTLRRVVRDFKSTHSKLSTKESTYECAQSENNTNIEKEIQGELSPNRN